jgi:hypothetical protein
MPPQSTVGKRDATRIAEDDAHQSALERKRAGRSGAKRALTSGPGRALRFARVNPKGTALIVLPGIASGGAAYGVAKSRKSEAGAAVAGGALSQAAYQGAAYGAGNYVRRRTGHNLTTAQVRSGHTPGVHPKLRDTSAWEAYHAERKAHLKGKSSAEGYRSFPKHLRYSTAERVMGHTHGGKLGTGIGTALTLAGAGGAAGAVHRRDVGKAMYGVQERKVEPSRVVEAAAGGALAAYGLSRLKMVGSLARYGARVAERNGANSRQVERVMSAASAVGRGTKATTGAGEKQLRRIKVLNNAIEQVPLALRPAVATTAGIMLVQHARPVHQNRFTPMGRYS